MVCVLKGPKEKNGFRDMNLLKFIRQPYSLNYLSTQRLEKAMAPHSSILAWKSHGWRSLVGCSPWVRKESDMTEWLHFHFSLLCIGERNGNPLQCSHLENPRDGVGRTVSDTTEVTWQQWQQYSKAETVYCSGIEHQRVWLWFHLGLEKIYP